VRLKIKMNNHKHVPTKDKQWNSNRCVCKCGFETNDCYEFSEHIGIIKTGYWNKDKKLFNGIDKTKKTLSNVCLTIESVTNCLDIKGECKRNKELLLDCIKKIKELVE
jgi:hypothetical protein